MALDFFTPDRTHFFRPLTWGRRELIAACLKALYETLYGPGAGQAAPMTRERLRILFIGVLRSRDWSQLVGVGSNFLPLGTPLHTESVRKSARNTTRYFAT